MSQENVEAALRGLAALNRRDAESANEVCDPAIEWTTELIGTTVYRGFDGVRQAVRDIDTAWESFEAIPVEAKDCGDRVFVAAHAVGDGRTTGAHVESDVFYVATFRNGKAISLRGFFDRSEALEAAGLSE